MKAILNIFGVIPLLFAVWASAWFLTENFNGTWNDNTIGGLALLGVSSVALIVKMHFFASKMN